MKERLFKASLVAMLLILLTAVGTMAQDQNGDVNCDSNLNILDILYLIDHKYNQGPEPCPILAETLHRTIILIPKTGI